MNLTLVGLSHQGTPLAVRERAFVPLERARELAARARGGRRGRLSLDLQPHGALPRRRGRRAPRARRARQALSGLAEGELRAVVYRLADEAAALHLLRVAAGLDSIVPGEGEILGQVRTAFEAGHDRTGARPRVPTGVACGEEGACRDRDRREPGVGLVGGGRARTAGLRTARRMPGAPDRRRSRRRARRPQPGGARRAGRVRRQSLAAACRGAGQAVRRRRARLRACRGRARRGRRGRLLHRRAGLGAHAGRRRRGAPRAKGAGPSS